MLTISTSGQVLEAGYEDGFTVQDTYPPASSLFDW